MFISNNKPFRTTVRNSIKLNDDRR